MAKHSVSEHSVDKLARTVRRLVYTRALLTKVAAPGTPPTELVTDSGRPADLLELAHMTT
jgi:hypothetical protein